MTTYMMKEEKDVEPVNKNPALFAHLDDIVRCARCGNDIEDGQDVYFSPQKKTFYCRSPCDIPAPKPSTKDVRKVASSLTVKYKDQPSEEEIRKQVKQDFDENDFEQPEEEVMGTVVQKRMKKSEQDLEEFRKEAKPVSKHD